MGPRTSLTIGIAGVAAASRGSRHLNWFGADLDAVAARDLGDRALESRPREQHCRPAEPGAPAPRFRQHRTPARHRTADTERGRTGEWGEPRQGEGVDPAPAIRVRRSVSDLTVPARRRVSQGAHRLEGRTSRPGNVVVDGDQFRTAEVVVPERPLPKADHGSIAIELGPVGVARHPHRPFHRMHRCRPDTRHPDRVHGIRAGGAAPAPCARRP
jgi:hypothetical protein